jgi:hypothetical protein
MGFLFLMGAHKHKAIVIGFRPGGIRVLKSV